MNDSEHTPRISEVFCAGVNAYDSSGQKVEDCAQVAVTFTVKQFRALVEEFHRAEAEQKGELTVFEFAPHKLDTPANIHDVYSVAVTIGTGSSLPMRYMNLNE